MGFQDRRILEIQSFASDRHLLIDEIAFAHNICVRIDGFGAVRAGQAGGDADAKADDRAFGQDGAYLAAADAATANDADTIRRK